MARQATPTPSETSFNAAATSRLGWRAEGEHPSASSTRSMNQLTVTTSNGRSLTVYDAGDPDGRPILFHHGTPASGKPFDPHIAFALEHGVRLISYDRAGYGNSTRHAGRAVFDVVRDVEAIADALALERFATWGLSGGGPHALATAAGLPHRVVAVASVASIGPPDLTGLDLTEGMGEGNIVEFAASGA
ncbi:MAG: alpha/beta hydrolase [Actinobacteria bacterium]|nr:MAG: alpha/beta hydrolase [Actinomycetota bacterium]